MARAIKVAIVGAGIAGLTAAWHLAKRGYHVRVFEQRVYLGGKLGAHRGRVNLAPAKPVPGDGTPHARDDESKKPPIKPHVSMLLDGHGDEVIRTLDQSQLPEWMPPLMEAHLQHRRSALGLSTAGAQSILPARCLEVERVHPPQSVAADQTATKSDREHVQAEWRVKWDERTVFDVTLYSNPFAPQRASATTEPKPQHLAIEISDAVYHEHCYHLFCNWYRNFWSLMDQIGIEKREAFSKHNELYHLFPGDAPIGQRTRTLEKLSAVGSGGKNLLSGAASPADMATWFYSMADLVSQPINPGRYLDQTSVHALLRSGWYATEESAKFHEFLLAKAFAVPPYLSSAYAYQAYIKYTLMDPDPMLWVLKGNSYHALFKKFEERLRSLPAPGQCDLALGMEVTQLLKPNDRITELKVRPADIFGSMRDPDDGKPAQRPGEGSASRFHPDYVILAVPPIALADLGGPFREHVPGLANVRKLQSGVTAALDLYFKRHLPDIPNGHVVLRDSRYGLTFVDNTQCWPRTDPNLTDLQQVHSDGSQTTSTCLNVAITDFYKIDGLSKPEATKLVIDELQEYLQFDPQDIDYSRTYLQMNNNEPLFLNEVGSEPWRPDTRTEIPNLFLAGDFCDNEIGVVSVEGAVVSGLLAARAVQARAREDWQEGKLTDVRPLLHDAKELEPICVELPETYPELNTAALKLMLAPYAVAAKTLARGEEFARHPERAFALREVKASVADMAAAPGEMAADGFNFAAAAAQWLAELPYKGDR
jgi:uncharacterized protein with NAD-binding domain and iron-sulfur cluster